MITNNFLPEFGRNTGAIIDVVTRSGTNEFHGDAYEFNRVNALAARDYFNPLTLGNRTRRIRSCEISSAAHSAARSRRTRHSFSSTPNGTVSGPR